LEHSGQIYLISLIPDYANQEEFCIEYIKVKFLAIERTEGFKKADRTRFFYLRFGLYIQDNTIFAKIVEKISAQISFTKFLVKLYGMVCRLAI